jgi:leucyl-tRNA synthetase
MRPDRYNFAVAEPRWRKAWEEARTFEAGKHPEKP